MEGESSEEDSSQVKQRVNAARDIQLKRYSKNHIFFNSQLNNNQMKKVCGIDAEGTDILKKAFAQLRLSARAYTRILKVSRTIADLENSCDIMPHHIAEAIQYRSLDRKFWG